MEGDRHLHCGKDARLKFQSTPSAWRETDDVQRFPDVIFHFNPLPPHGGRQHFSHSTPIAIFISIHSLRMEGDISIPGMVSSVRNFNPLPPHGGRRENQLRLLWICCISIHSLRMEGDFQPRRWVGEWKFISIHSLRMEGDASGYCQIISIFHFNPLPPHGGRRFVRRKLQL